jgi:glycerophosphoryl diester phosphodiesterase
MFENERDYAPAVDALKLVLENLPGKIVAIGGLPGVGKTTLARYLAYRFNVSMIETDMFLIRDQGVMKYHNDWINRVIASRIDRDDDWQRPVIVEGATVLRLLDEIGRTADFFIHVTDEDAPESRGSLAADLKEYEAEYTPPLKANLHLNF